MMNKPLSIAMYQPDIPQNVGAMIRLCACLGLSLEIIEPCGFPWHEKKVRQSAMDYFDLVKPDRHQSWEAFRDHFQGRRIILMTTKSSVSYLDFEFQAGDILLAGQESAGAPEHVHENVDGRVLIPMHGDARSLNIVNATAMITGEVLRQIV